MRAKPRILLVEDDPNVLVAIARILEDAFIVMRASSIREASTMIVGAEEPSGILCDLNLPDGTAVDLYNAWCKARPAAAARFVVMSGGPIDRALPFSMEARICKPCPPAELLDRITRILER